MSKTLLIAEKPSVGQDLARVLTGPFKKQEGYLEGPEDVITWAVGHLVQLAEPDAYDPKYKSWRMADLPIVPDHFKLVVRDERSRKQMSVVTKQLGREDVEEVVNACDAGREGELIFAYLYEKAKGKKPVRRLWLNSMTSAAMKERASRRCARRRSSSSLEEAARSRSEADWIVGMNATRAATIRLRSSFDGAVSLGRVQTPTLAIVARREEEIRAFKPEPYWLVDATFARRPLDGGQARAHLPRPLPGPRPAARASTKGPRIATEQEAPSRSCAACAGEPGTITKLEKKEQREKAPMLYDLTTLQREANNRYGFSAKRTLAAAQRLYEEHKALTYPRTNSRYLTTDMVEEIKPIAELVGTHAGVPRRPPSTSPGSTCCRWRAWSTTRRSPTTTRSSPPAPSTSSRRWAPTTGASTTWPRGASWPCSTPRRCSRTRAWRRPSTAPGRAHGGLAAHVFRTRGKLLLVPGWRGVYDEASAGSGDEERAEGEEDDDADQQLPRLEEDEQVQTREIESARKETKPPRRYSDASLLGAMETAGKLVDDDELREAMKDSGIGTPATRAAIIERLITVGYLERDGRALVATREGPERDQAARRARAHLART